MSDLPTFRASVPTLDDLQPTAYHLAVVDYLRQHEPELWRWASSAEAERGYLEELRTSLLKECYRLDADGHPELIRQAMDVAKRLGIQASITLYQSSGNAPLNAALFYTPGEAHIVFSGPVITTLDASELAAVLAHELAHYRLWEQHGGVCLLADRLLTAASNDSRAAASHIHTARRLRLYTEIYADRGAFIGCGSLESAVAALVKMATGLNQVSATSYLKQADELFIKGERASRGIGHPETFIRARALRLWTERDASLDVWLAAQIEGDVTLDELDVVGQLRLTRHTRRLLENILSPKWLQSAAVMAHAKSFFPDIKPAAHFDPELLAEPKSDSSIHDYFCYLLLDFARADRELDDVPLAHFLTCSGQLGFQERFEQLIVKELGLNKRQLNKLKKDAPNLIEKASRA